MPRRKPAPKRPRGGVPRVSLETYQRMWEAYQEKQSVEHVRRRVGISWRTADKYIDKGDPSRGLEGLRDRFARVMQKAQRQEEYGLARARADTLKLIRAYKSKLAQRIKAIDLKDMSTAIGVELDRVARLEDEMLMKAPPVDQTAESLFAGWTEEELEEYAKTGRWPDRPLDAPRGGTGDGSDA